MGAIDDGHFGVRTCRSMRVVEVNREERRLFRRRRIFFQAARERAMLTGY